MQIKYRGWVFDKMDALPPRKTKYYLTYDRAHKAAEKLAKKHFTDNRYEIHVIY